MTQLIKRPPDRLDENAINAYAGMFVLKMMDLKPQDGGMVFPLALPSDLSPLQEVLHALSIEGHVEQNSRKQRWDLTKSGLAHLGRLIEEAEDLMDEFDDEELPAVIAELRSRNLDVMRARFLWGWFDGEFDDLAEFQRARGVKPVQELWAYYLTDDEFYTELAKDLTGDGPPADDDRDDRRDQRDQRGDDDDD